MWRRNGLTIVTASLFLLFWAGQAAAGFRQELEERREHGRPPVAFAGYLASGAFWEATAENWESEFLQMAAFVWLTAFLRQKGSSQSRPIEGEAESDRAPRRRAGAPWPVHRGGLLLAIYERSLTLALLGLFLFSFALHAVAGHAAWAEEQVLHGERGPARRVRREQPLLVRVLPELAERVPGGRCHRGALHLPQAAGHRRSRSPWTRRMPRPAPEDEGPVTRPWTLPRPHVTFPAMATMTSVNPATGEVIGRFEELSDAELEARLARAAQTFRSWRRRPFAERAALMRARPSVLEQRKEHWARTMTLEMGKTFKSAVAEAEKCAWVCRFYAENAERFLADEEVKASATRCVRALPAARPGARGHAVELPVLAGLPLRRAGAHGRERRAAQARLERPAVARSPSRRSSASPASRTAASRRCSSAPRASRASSRTTGSRRRRSPAARARARRSRPRRARSIKKTVLELGGIATRSSSCRARTSRRR